MILVNKCVWRAEDLGAYLYDADVKQSWDHELTRVSGKTRDHHYCLNKYGLPARLFRLRCRRLAHGAKEVVGRETHASVLLFHLLVRHKLVRNGKLSV